MIFFRKKLCVEGGDAIEYNKICYIIMDLTKLRFKMLALNNLHFNKRGDSNLIKRIKVG